LLLLLRLLPPTPRPIMRCCGLQFVDPWLID
jgi:hypothetical protein